MADGVWKGVQPLVFRSFRQSSQNKFFNASTPFIRKGCDREKKGEKTGGKNEKDG